MDTPKEFLRMTRSFNEWTKPDPMSLEKWAAVVLDRFSPDDKATIKSYVSELLDSRPTAKELQAVWNAGMPEYILSDDALRTLLGIVHAS